MRPVILTCGLFSAILGLSILGICLISTSQADLLVRVAGLPAVLVTIVLVAHGAWRNRLLWRTPPRALLAIALATVLLHVVQRHQFKIEPDEHVIGTTALMIASRGVACTAVESSISPLGQDFATLIDKRPLAFPTLIALLHRVSGYRPSNSLWANAMISALFCFLAWHIGSARSGSQGGLAALLFWLGIPLLHFVATSGGNELLNITLLLAAAVVTSHAAAVANSERLGAAISVTLLLAQSRPEAPLTAAAFLLVITTIAARSGASFPRWFLFAPALLIPTIAIRRIAAGEEWAPELELAGVGERFSISNVGNNLTDALRFLFSSSSPSAPFLLAIGVVLIPAVVRAVRTERASAELLAPIALLLAGLSTAAVSLLYFWGKWTDPIVCRTVLPVFLVPFAVLLIALREISERPKLRVSLVVCLALHAILWVPVCTRVPFLPSSTAPSLAVEAAVANGENARTLWITGNPMQALLHGSSAVTFATAEHQTELLEQHLRNGRVQRVCAVQWYRSDGVRWQPLDPPLPALLRFGTPSLIYRDHEWLITSRDLRVGP